MLEFIFNIVVGLLTCLGLLMVYALYRNQRAAAKSLLVETTNFGPRIAAIVEVVLHPERAVTWEREVSADDPLVVRKTWDEGGNAVFFARVFPMLDKDSSEIYGIRDDDGRVT